MIEWPIFISPCWIMYYCVWQKKNPKTSETTAVSASSFLQMQSAAPLWLVLVSHHGCVNGPWPFFQPLSLTLLPQLTPPLRASMNHTWAGLLVLFISCPSLHRLQISLSIFCHLYSSTHLALLSVSCPVCHTCAVSFCLPESHLYLFHLLPP